MQIHQHSVGREPCEDGIVTITEAALPCWTSLGLKLTKCKVHLFASECCLLHVKALIEGKSLLILCSPLQI